MREIPACLNRRYNALDDLIKDLSAMSNRSSTSECHGGGLLSRDPEIKLMCDFWKILKEDPCCDLPHTIHQRLSTRSSRVREWPHGQRLTCYMANEDRSTCGGGGKDGNKINITCCQDNERKRERDRAKQAEIAPSPTGATPGVQCCSSTAGSEPASESMPLSKVLCNLKEAASFDKKCTERLTELIKTEKRLRQQIQYLEDKETQGLANLKQAECMWNCMEEAYKQKVAESLERQKDLLKQLHEVEKSANKWRKNKKDLESQMKNITKCQKEIIENINNKSNDLKGINAEIEGLKKRMEITAKELEGTKRSLGTKKLVSDAKIAKIAKEEANHAQNLKKEKADKKKKEDEGNKYIKEAREELQKICKVLLQKKLENEDLSEERNALKSEINMLKVSCDECKEKCKEKQLSIGAEINKLDAEIAGTRTRCIRCHANIDTNDMRKLCNDCPRCLEERECLIEGDHCVIDHTMDCVCQSIKKKFLDNVFENMYTVLERQVQTGPGKAVAETVLNCLKRSRNGKLNEDTRKILQEFILTTVKRNLNLTIVGGAVKTRCEMDTETYNQLMLCLKKIKVAPVPKQDKATNVKKEPCRRWAGTSECNCPKGPKACICTKKAPKPPRDPTPCPPDPEDKEDPGEKVVCPHKSNTTCGPECGSRGLPNMVGADVAAWRPDPCSTKACPYSKNMRAAQCVLGPESISSVTTSYKTAVPLIPSYSYVDEPNCKCGKKATKKCTCHGETKSRPRQRFIEEVMGRYYTDVAPIEKVSSVRENEFYGTNMGRLNMEECISSMKTNSLKQTNAPTNHRTSLLPTHNKDISVASGNDIGYNVNNVDIYHVTEELSTQLVSHYLESVDECVEESTNVRDETELSTNIIRNEKNGTEDSTQNVQINLDKEFKELPHHIIDAAAIFEDIQSLRDEPVKENHLPNNFIPSTTDRKNIQEYLKEIIESAIVLKNDYETELPDSASIQWVTVESLLEKINDLLIESSPYSKTSVEQEKSSSESFQTCSQFISEKKTPFPTANNIKPKHASCDPYSEEITLNVTDIMQDPVKDTSNSKLLSNDIKIDNKPSKLAVFNPKNEITSNVINSTQETANDTSDQQLEDKEFLIYESNFDITEKISPHLYDIREKDEMRSLGDLSYLIEDTSIGSLPNINVEPENLSDSLESMYELSDDDTTNYFNINEKKRYAQKRNLLKRNQLNKLYTAKERNTQNKLKNRSEKEKIFVRAKSIGNRDLPIIIKCKKTGQNSSSNK